MVEAAVVSTTASAALPPESSNKRKNMNGQRQKSSNKRRKKNKKSNPHHNSINNWIENCSETIHRIPSNRQAPLTCIITRVEMDEEPVHPNDEKVGRATRNEENAKEERIKLGDTRKGGRHASVNECTTMGYDNGNEEKKMGVTRQAEACDSTNVTSTTRSISNIARPSASFLARYVQEKEIKTIDKENEATQMFIPVKRHISAIGPTKWQEERKRMANCKHMQDFSKHYHHLPHGDNGDGVLNPYPTSSVPDKFWAQRKRLFSRYDMGIRIGGGNEDEDEDYSPEMWYSVTPESIANHIAERMVKIIFYQKEIRRMGEMTPCNEKDSDNCETREEGDVFAPTNDEAERVSPRQRKQNDIIILDLFCGCGGNSIAFARWNNNNTRKDDETGHQKHHQQQCDDDDGYYAGPSPRVKVIAVDNNLSRLKNAAHNASIYDVKREDIIFVHADAVEVLHQYRKGVLQVTRIYVDGCISSCGKADSDEAHKIDHSKYGRCAGFALGGMDLLPENIDGLFLSPPWGGMSYGNKTFEPTASITVESAILEETSQQDEDANNNTEGGGNTKRTTTVTTNGAQLFSIATNAVFDDSKELSDGVIAYFLPRNINGIALGHSAIASGVVGCFEMEQNVICGKVKTVTAYFGRGLEDTL